MRRLLVIISVYVFLFFSFSDASPSDNRKPQFQVKKQLELQQVKPKKPVKIRLKRLSEGKYTWDLTGDDADEIVRADKRLRKLLNIE